MDPVLPDDAETRSNSSDESEQSYHTIVGAGPDQILDAIQREEATMQKYHDAVRSGVVPESTPDFTSTAGLSLNVYCGIILFIRRPYVLRLERMWTARDPSRFDSKAEQQEIHQRITSCMALFEDAYTAGEAYVDDHLSVLVAERGIVDGMCPTSVSKLLVLDKIQHILDTAIVLNLNYPWEAQGEVARVGRPITSVAPPIP